MERESLIVSGSVVSFLQHGDPRKDAVILVHCGGGHSGWWSHLLPKLTEFHHVVTVDLTGHGESGRRAHYEPEMWADEVCNVIRSATSNGRAALVGHSLGGLVGIYAAAQAPSLVSRLILVDPPVLHVQARESPLPARTYKSMEEALSRFRLRPPETIASIERLQEVARDGLKQVQGGWSWKYDPKASQRFTVEGVAEQIARLECDIACIYGERSQFVDETTVAYISEIANRPVISAVVPAAYHHIPLDAPAALCAEVTRALESETA